MHRRLLIIAICLVLGTAVNVTVAWACGERSHKTVGDASRLPSDAHWPRSVPPDWPRPTFRATASSFGRTIIFHSADTRRGFYSQRVYQWGWPLRSLESEAHSRAQPAGRVLKPKPIDSAHGFLRICPAWPGFVGNTIIYAALFWPPFAAGWISVQRFLRRRRGLCVACAYDLRGDFSKGCPECGWRREPAAVPLTPNS